MRINVHSPTLIVMLCWLSFFSFAQQPPSNAKETPPNIYLVDLKKEFSSWLWFAQLKSTVKTGEKSALALSDNFYSSLFRSSSEDKWRDDNFFHLFWHLAPTEKFATRSFLTSKILADENTGRSFNKHLLAQKFFYNPHPKIQLQPALGVAFEEAFDIQDQGWYASVGVDISKLDMGGYLNYTDLNSTIRGFPGRKNQDHSFFTAWNKKFSQYATDSLRIGFQLLENRYFISSGMEEVFINSRFLYNELQYRLTNSSFLKVLTNFKNRSVDQRTPTPFAENPDSIRLNLREELVLENEFEHLIYKPKFRIQNKVLFSQIRNDNSGFDTDINTLQTAFSSTLQWLPSSSGLFWGKFSFTKFEYNTPNVTNQGGLLASLSDREDRDEQGFIIDGGYRHRFSPFFSATIKGNIHLYHQIYIRSGRSQNNNWNRIYQMSTLLNHELSDAVSHIQQFKVLADYTTFDFESVLGQVRSFVFRKFIYDDTLNIALTGNLDVNSIYRLEKQDNGTFFQEDFTQLVTKELTAHFFNLNVSHKNFLGLRVSSGVAFFIRDEWQFDAMRERRQVRKFRSITPRLTVTYPAGSRLLLFMSYAPNRSTNATRNINADNFSETIQFFTRGSLKLRYTF